MQREIDPLILQVADDHKTAYQTGKDGLFRYSFYSKKYAYRHAALFTDGLLYHSNPNSFNDPLTVSSTYLFLIPQSMTTTSKVS